jgi:protease IV
MQDDRVKTNDIADLLVRDLIIEKRRDRRWKNIRFFMVIVAIICSVYLIFSETGPTVVAEDHREGYVSFVRLEGTIGPAEDFSAENVLPLLKDAFSDSRAKGVVLDINSGGGTPVQAAIIHDAILDLKKRYHKSVVVVGEDLLASGAYYIAVAADSIYVNPNTITGSIGVIMKGFGFNDVIKKLGVERRVYTSGVDKDRLDPFLPLKTQDIDKIKTVISEVHDNFNQVVLEGRKGRLKAAPDKLFTGDFWSGTSALKLGLVDHLGNISDALHNEFNVSQYKDYSGSESLMKSMVGKLGTSINQVLSDNDIRVLEKI